MSFSVLVKSASNLPNIERFSKSDPFTVITLQGELKKLFMSTSRARAYLPLGLWELEVYFLCALYVPKRISWHCVRVPSSMYFHQNINGSMVVFVMGGWFINQFFFYIPPLSFYILQVRKRRPRSSTTTSILFGMRYSALEYGEIYIIKI